MIFCIGYILNRLYKLDGSDRWVNNKRIERVTTHKAEEDYINTPNPKEIIVITLQKIKRVKLGINSALCALL